MSVDNIYPYSSNKLLIRYSFRYTEIEYVYPHSYYKLWVRHSFSYTEIESQCNKYPWSFENISWIENIYFITPANLRQNGSLVIWGSQILKDPSHYHSLTPKLKTEKLKLKTSYCITLLWHLPEYHRTSSIEWIMTKKLRNSSNLHCLISKHMEWKLNGLKVRCEPHDIVWTLGPESITHAHICARPYAFQSFTAEETKFFWFWRTKMIL